MKRTYLRIMALAALFIAAQQAYAMHNLKTVVTRFMPIMASAIKTNAPMAASAVRVAHNANQPVGLFNRFFCTTPIRKAPDFTSKDPYKILDIKRGASQQEIKEAYHKTVKENHPDTCKNPDAKDNTQKINSAYEDLKKNANTANTDTDFENSTHYYHQPQSNGSWNDLTQRCQKVAFGYPSFAHGLMSQKETYFHEGGRVIWIIIPNHYVHYKCDQGPVGAPNTVKGYINYDFFGGFGAGGMRVEFTRPRTDQDRQQMEKVNKLTEQEMPKLEKRREAFMKKVLEYGIFDEHNINVNSRAAHFANPSPEKYWHFLFENIYQFYYGAYDSKTIRPVIDQTMLEDHLYHNRDVYACAQWMMKKEAFELDRYEQRLAEYEADLEIYKQKQYEKMIDRRMSESIY